MKDRTLNIGYLTEQESERLERGGIDTAGKIYSVKDLIKSGVVLTNVVGPAMARGTMQNVKPIFDAKIPYNNELGELDLSGRRILFSEELESVRTSQSNDSRYSINNSTNDISNKMEQVLYEAEKINGLEAKLQVNAVIHATNELISENGEKAKDYREFLFGSEKEAIIQRSAGFNSYVLDEIFSCDIKLNKINGISYELVGSRFGALNQGSPILSSNNDLSKNTDATFYINGVKKRLNVAVVELARHGLSQMNEGLNSDDSDQVYMTMKEFEDNFMSEKKVSEESQIFSDVPISRDDFSKVKSRLDYRVKAWTNKNK